MIKGFKIGVRAFWLLLLVIVIVVGGLFYALQYDSFQTNLTKKATDWLTQKLGSEVSIGRVTVRWLDEIRLEDVKIKDLDGRDMISVKEIYVNCATNFKFDGATIVDFDNNLDFVMLKEPDVRIIREENGKLNIDLWLSKIGSLAVKKDSLKLRRSKPFTIDEAVIQNGKFTLVDPHKERFPKELFDYANFEINGISGNLKDFFVHRDTIIFEGRGIKGLEPRSNLAIKKIDTDFFYSKKKILLQKLDARINNSIIKSFVGLYYDTPADLNQFITKVNLKGNLRNSVFDSKDLGRFSSSMYAYEEKYKLDADLYGRVSDLYFENANLGFGKESHIAGNGHFKGLPKVKEAFYHMEVAPSMINAPDAQQYAGKENYSQYVEQFKKVNFNGLFKGTFDDFYTDAKVVSSNLGRVEGKLIFEIEPLSGTPVYNADVVQSSVDLGKIIGNKDLRYITFKGKLRGEGSAVDNASIDMDGKISEIWFNDYNFRNINVAGVLRKSVFDGKVRINDPNLVANVVGQVDFNPADNKFRIDGKIDKSNLMPLGFSKEPALLQTEFDFDFDGNQLDNWLGEAAFTNTFVNHHDRNLVVDKMKFISRETGGVRNMGIRTEYFDGDIYGEFVPTELVSDLLELTEEYRLFFSGNKADREIYYETKKSYSLRSKYAAHYNIDVKNTDDFFAFFNPDIEISKGMKISGDFKIESTSQFSILATADTILYKGNEFYENELDFFSSKNAYSPDVLTVLILYSDKQKLNNVDTESLELNGSWGDSRNISFDAAIRQQESNNKALVFGEIDFLKDGFSVSLNPKNSSINLLDYNWQFDANNRVVVYGREIQFEDFRVSNKRQSLALSGFISNDPTKKLFAAINEFDLRVLEPIAALNVQGIADGDLSVSDFYDSPILLSNIVFTELIYKNILVGDVNAVIDWDRFLGKVKIESKIDRKGVQILDVTGTYDPKGQEGMSLVAKLKDTNLEILGTFVDNMFSDLKGLANGKLAITGEPVDPIVRGEIKIKEGQLRIDATGGYLYFNDRILFTEEGFVAANEGFKVYDAKLNGNEAYLKGGVFNGGGGNFMMGLHAYIKDPDGFLLLNTTSEQNDTFYGSAYASGDIHLTGSFQNVLISGRLVSKPRSKVTIPLDGAQRVDTDSEAIPFAMKPTDKLLEEGEEPIENEVNTNGLKISMNLTLTPDAEVEIILDRTNNDKLNAFGNARLSLDYDTRGDKFTMSGPYEVVSGKYDFSFQNLASLRKFEISQGSRITWSGDPYNAVVALKATYKTNIDLSTLWTSNDNPDAETDNTRYPVNVTVNITDQLQTPNINYELSFDQNQIPSRHQTDLLAFEQKLKDNEQLLSRHVSSVIAFNKLFPDNNIRDAFDQQFLIDNINSLLTNQIGNLANKLDPNLEVGVLLGDFRENLLNNLQLNFTYKFLNNRVKLSGRSSYSNGLANAATFAATQSQLTVGGELEYLLSDDGTWRLKVHSRSVPNANYSFLNASTGNVMVSGASVLFSRNFNSFFAKKPVKVTVGVGTKPEDPPEVSLAE